MTPLHQQPVTAVADTDATPALAGESDETQEVSTGKEIESVGRLYTIKAIAGKGKGLVAATKILKGTRILSEVPMFRVPRDNSDIEALERIVAKEVECLNKDQQRTFFDLANIYGNAHSRPLGIARTNVLPFGSKASSGGLFPEASRINHSCRHNSQNTWNENIGRLTIHALRDIEEGEEITITYLAITSEYADRQRFLKEKFKFDCKCELCSLPRAQQKRSDARLREIQTIDSSIGNFFWGGLESERAHDAHSLASTAICLRSAQMILSCYKRQFSLKERKKTFPTTWRQLTRITISTYIVLIASWRQEATEGETVRDLKMAFEVLSILSERWNIAREIQRRLQFWMRLSSRLFQT